MILNSQVYDTEGNKLKNTLKTFGEIVSQFEHDKITGIISKNYPIFNEETKQVISNFFINLFNKNTQGVSLLRARQQYIANKMQKIVEAQVKNATTDLRTAHIDLQSSLAISSYLLFGKPWKKIIS